MSLTITSFVFDQNIYTPGETMNLTVNYTSTDSIGLGNIFYSTTVTVSTTASTTSATSTGSNAYPEFVINEGSITPLATTVAVTDNRTPPGTWTLVSNTLSTTSSPYTGVAVLTSVA